MNRFREEIEQQPEIAARLLKESGPALDAIARAYAEQRPGGFVIAAPTKLALVDRQDQPSTSAIV